MPTPRRTILLAAATLAAPRLPHAQSRPLRFVVPYPPGGSADLMARALAAHLSGRSGRAVVVENRPGAGGTIGTAAVARAAPNGETILQGDIGALSIGLAAGRPGYAAEDFVPIARLTIDPVVLAARADGPFADLPAVIARARAQPGAVSYATPGILSHLHLATERFARLAGIELNHIPFQGSAAGVTAVLAGQVDLIAVPPTNVTAAFRRLGLTPAPLGAEAFAAFWSTDRAAMEPLVAALPRG